MITFILQVKKTKFREIVAYPLLMPFVTMTSTLKSEISHPMLVFFFFFLMALSQIYCDPDTLESWVPLPTATYQHDNVS